MYSGGKRTEQTALPSCEHTNYFRYTHCIPHTALMVKNPPANAGDPGDKVPSLVYEDLLEEGTATHSSTLAWRIPMDRGAWWATVHGITVSNTTEQLSTAHTDYTFLTSLLVVTLEMKTHIFD